MISIIVPVYNLDQYIERTLENIEKQTYKDIEIIVVNDGSTDGTKDILKKLENQYSNLTIVHRQNGGVTSARLAGVKVAKGEWIGFVDGDDLIDEEMYERLLNNALQYNAKISHCGYQMVFEDGRIHYFYNTGRIVLQNNITSVKDLLEGNFVEPGLCNKLFHKSLFGHILNDNIVDTSIKINEDLLMNYYLFIESEVSVYQDFCPYHYMIRDNSASRSRLNENKIYDPIRVKQIIYDRVPGEIKKIAKKMYIATCVNVYNSIIMNKGYEKEKKDVYQLIYREKKQFNLLNKRTKLLAKMICYLPILYPIIYKIYANCFQKKKYD